MSSAVPKSAPYDALVSDHNPRCFYYRKISGQGYNIRLLGRDPPKVLVKINVHFWSSKLTVKYFVV